MTLISTLKKGWKLHKHQVILLDKKGYIFESCNSIFDVSKYMDTPLSENWSFFETEFNTIANSQASKITFEKIQIHSESLPGCYDFIFSKYQHDNQEFIVWKIYDLTKIYEKYKDVQQLQNELSIQEQWLESNTINKFTFSQSSKFFQTDYVAENKFDLSYLLNDFAKSKFDIFNLIPNEHTAHIIANDVDSLKANINFLMSEINYFVRILKDPHLETMDIRALVDTIWKDYKINHNNTPDNYTVEANLPQEITGDRKLVYKLGQILCSQDNVAEKSKKTLKLGYVQQENDGHFLLLTLNEYIQSEENFTKASVSTFIKLSILKSLATMIGGSLNTSLLENESIFSVNLMIPVK